MNCNVPTDICFSFAGFRSRGGLTDEHGDGWGIATSFLGRGCQVAQRRVGDGVGAQVQRGCGVGLQALDEVGYPHFASVKIYRNADWEEAARTAITFLREKCAKWIR